TPGPGRRPGGRPATSGVRSAGAAHERSGPGRHPGADHGRGVGRALVRLHQDARHAHLGAAPEAARGRRRPRPAQHHPRRRLPPRTAMTRRILTTILAVTTLAVALFGVPLALGVRRLYYDEAVVRLEREAAEAGIAVPASFAASRDPVELPEPGGGVRLALYGADG